MEEFRFHSPGALLDGELELVLVDTLPAKVSPWAVPSYIFEMRHTQSQQRMGRVTLRIGSIDTIVKYAGQVGYSVDPPFRGHRFAERSVRLILPLAHKHGLSGVWITCSPDNVASRITLERLGAQFVEVIDVPDDYPLPEGAIRKKSRYRIENDQ